MASFSPAGSLKKGSKKDEKESGPGYGGVYLGPASDFLHQAPAPVQRPPSNPPSRTQSQKRKEKETPHDSPAKTAKDAPVWGGVYVGPASEVPQSARSRTHSSGGGRNDEDKENKTGLAETLRSSFRMRKTTPESANSKSSNPVGGKVKCHNCRKKCTGDVLKAEAKYFHVECFKCKECRVSLKDAGYFESKSLEFLCPHHYHAKYGSKCPICGQYVEGEVAIVMGKAYHQQCFRCDRCKQPFPQGQKVTFTGREHLCQKCLHIPVAKVKPLATSTPSVAASEPSSQAQQRPVTPSVCNDCGEPVISGQVLHALDLNFHPWCFKCTTCGTVLHGEYMAKNDQPYCIRDYNALFGIRCDECNKFIAGRVLQAGDYHFHPSCARCARCGDPFADGEEMYTQGDEIWHPRCNDLKLPDTIVHPPRSPRTSYAPKYSGDFGKHLTYMYLLPEPDMGYLKHPVSPHPPEHLQQFHTPVGPVKIRKGRFGGLKTGMAKLMESLEENQPRPKSPHMNNEEPIELAHYPGAHYPEPGEVPPIDREDFPAPFYAYAVDDIRRRLSHSDVENEGADQVDAASPEQEEAEKKILKAEEVLKKCENTWITQTITADLEEKIKQLKAPRPVDPRSQSRAPNARKPPPFRLRYESAINASPSRYMNRPRPWEYWGKKKAATTTIPYYQTPKPGYGLAPQKAATLPDYSFYYPDMSYDEMETIRSSMYSAASTIDSHWTTGTMPIHYGGRHMTPIAPHLLRSSLPDMSKPPKIYPYEQLLTTNKRLPEDVDRCHLERHLTRDEFEKLFTMMPIEFYRLPEWRRINMKRKVKLF